MQLLFPYWVYTPDFFIIAKKGDVRKKKRGNTVETFGVIRAVPDP
jgi:hypothetical protein